jgi:hypothetical protein
MTDKIDDFVPMTDRTEETPTGNEYVTMNVDPNTDRTENFKPIPDKATFDLETDRYIGASEHEQGNNPITMEKPAGDGSRGSIVLGVLNLIIILVLSYFIFFI